jgi:predicted CoA-substrate-specific enzyme activase
VIVAGVDIGSLTAKAVILEGKSILGYAIIPTGTEVVKVAERSLSLALNNARVLRDQLAAIVATGYGRAKVPLARRFLTEITCDAKGARFLFPEARMVIDIGGQDSKVISLDGDGRVLDFTMNDKCAAGTGRFLEVMAQALRIDLSELGKASLRHNKRVAISSMCTVFAESEVVSLIAEGNAKEDILYGLHQAIAGRICAMVRSLQIAEPVTLAGGVAKNISVRRAIEQDLKISVKVPFEPQIVAALGAAIFAQELLTNESQSRDCSAEGSRRSFKL